MNDASIKNPAYYLLTDQQLSEIDELCDRFDRELVNATSPCIEAFLADMPEAARDILLAELLAMEVEYLTQQGEDPQPENYIERFPERQHVISAVFASDAKTEFPSDGSPPEIENFRLIEEIGRGGMGVVWLAEQLEPVQRRVALKLIKSELTSKEVLGRFAAEKQALAMMDHPNIARVLDAGTTEDGQPYFVMELVDGIPITQYCDDNKLSVDERLKLFVPVCKAVQHAHQKGIAHRDLKPSNVLVTDIDGEAVPKIIDFGLAKAVEQRLQLTDVSIRTEFGKVVGTVQYMSPEQAELKAVDAEDIDTRTDVYSLGAMLYELLTGSTPLDEETLTRNALLKVLEIIREQDPPRPSNRLSSSTHDVSSVVGDLRRLHPARLQQLLRGELDWVVMKALEKEPDRRYQTANDLGQDLSNYLTGETVTARPPSTWYRLRKFGIRNRGFVTAVLAIVVALLIGIAGTNYGLFRANDKSMLVGEVEAQRVTEAEASIDGFGDVHLPARFTAETYGVNGNAQRSELAGHFIGIKDGEAKILQATLEAVWARKFGIKTIQREVLEGGMVALKTDAGYLPDLAKTIGTANRYWEVRPMYSEPGDKRLVTLRLANSNPPQYLRHGGYRIYNSARLQHEKKGAEHAKVFEQDVTWHFHESTSQPYALDDAKRILIGQWTANVDKTEDRFGTTDLHDRLAAGLGMTFSTNSFVASIDGTNASFSNTRLEGPTNDHHFQFHATDESGAKHVRDLQFIDKDHLIVTLDNGRPVVLDRSGTEQ